MGRARIRTVLAVASLATLPACTYTYAVGQTRGGLVREEPSGDRVRTGARSLKLDARLDDQDRLVVTGTESPVYTRSITQTYATLEQVRAVRVDGSEIFFDLAFGYGLAGLMHAAEGDFYLGRPKRCVEWFGDRGIGVFENREGADRTRCIFTDGGTKAGSEEHVPTTTEEAGSPEPARSRSGHPVEVILETAADGSSAIRLPAAKFDADGRAVVDLRSAELPRRALVTVRASEDHAEVQAVMERTRDGHLVLLADEDAMSSMRADLSKAMQVIAERRRAEEDKQRAEAKAAADREQQEQEAWKNAGFLDSLCTPSIPATCAKTWRDLGFSATETRSWMVIHFDPTAAAAWRAAGLSPADAKGWAGFTPDEMRSWDAAGFSAADAARLKGARIDVKAAKDWRESGFPVDQVLDYDRRGFSLASAKRAKEQCSRGIESPYDLIKANPFDVGGRCFQFAGEKIQIFDRTHGLYVMSRELDPFFVEFTTMSAPTTVFQGIVSGVGPFTYTTAAGVQKIVPSLLQIDLRK